MRGREVEGTEKEKGRKRVDREEVGYERMMRVSEQARRRLSSEDGSTGGSEGRLRR